MCSEQTSRVEKQVAASINNRRRRPAQDVSSSSCVDSSFFSNSHIHRYVRFRASRNTAHARLEIFGSVVEAKRRLLIRAKEK
jgi:hypothetical protein